MATIIIDGENDLQNCILMRAWTGYWEHGREGREGREKGEKGVKRRQKCICQYSPQKLTKPLNILIKKGYN